MVKKRGLPERGELVVCRISKINPNSAFVILEEYGTDRPKEGMIHISEISKGWIRDIRQFIKKDQIVIGKIMRVEDRNISLSLKRVSPKQEKDKIKEYKLNQRAEKFLEFAAKDMGKTIDQAYEEIGYMLLESFGSLYQAFLASIQKPELLTRKGVSDDWIRAMKKIAEKNIEQKEFVFRAKLFMKTYKPDGIHTIKNILGSVKKMGFEVSYIAAPEYLLKYRTMNAKKGEKEFTEKLNKISKKSEAEIRIER